MSAVIDSLLPGAHTETEALADRPAALLPGPTGSDRIGMLFLIAAISFQQSDGSQERF